MQDFAPYSKKCSWSTRLKGHFMLWRATRLRKLGALLATYWLFLISTPADKWHINSVCHWLQSNGLDKFAATFRGNFVNQWRQGVVNFTLNWNHRWLALEIVFIPRTSWQFFKLWNVWLPGLNKTYKSVHFDSKLLNEQFRLEIIQLKLQLCVIYLE